MKKFLSLFLLIFIGPLIFLSFLGLAASQTIYKPAFIKKELLKFDAYNQIYANIPTIVENMKGKEGDGAAKNEEKGGPFTAAETQALFQKAISVSDLQYLTEAFVDGVWPWFFGSEPAVGAKLDITSLKAKAEAEILAAFKAKYMALPICRRARDFTGDLTSGCRPAGVSFEVMKAQIETEKGIKVNFLSAYPDTLTAENIAKISPESQKQFQNFQNIKGILSSNRYLIYIWPIFLLSLVLLAARLYAGNWFKTLSVYGFYLIIVAAGSFVSGYLLFYLTEGSVNFLTKKIPLPETLINSLVNPLRQDLVKEITVVLNQIILVVFIIGVVLIVTYFILKYFIHLDDQRTGWSLKEKKV